jgi:hypothetical protein
MCPTLYIILSILRLLAFRALCTFFILGVDNRIIFNQCCSKSYGYFLQKQYIFHLKELNLDDYFVQNHDTQSVVNA